ncbi:MAG: hypothetical protein HKO56_08985, partial [Bacteroidia bacterium]|nr:hypothetical protein [Bacteroidia bacterium]NNM16780.1 hypothetical protein [Bacteroidia bacterium]
STLYSLSQKKERHQWYKDKIALGEMKHWDNAMQFHLQSNNNTENAILMKREHVGTVSVTSVKLSDETTEMKYLDLQNKEEIKVNLNTAVLNK